MGVVGLDAPFLDVVLTVALEAAVLVADACRPAFLADFAARVAEAFEGVPLEAVSFWGADFFAAGDFFDDLATVETDFFVAEVFFVGVERLEAIRHNKLQAESHDNQ